MPPMISCYSFHQVCIGFFTTEITTDYDAHLTVLYCNRLSFLLSNTMISTASSIYETHIVLRRMYNN